MYVETSDKKTLLEALAIGGDVKLCYRIVRERIRENPKRIYLALDFPAFMDISSDFVAIMSIENSKFNLFAIPYNPVNGQQFDYKCDGLFLKALAKEMRNQIQFNQIS